MALPVGHEVEVDADGRMVQTSMIYPCEEWQEFWEQSETKDATVSDAAVNPVEVLLTISFMNVVNARRDDEPEHRHTTKTLKKKGIVPIAMNRIRLPAARSSSRADVKAATGGTMPLHLVRGHFKTYTADAPLFGRQTGTYWWGWQSRGKAERGVRGHTYEVGTDDRVTDPR